MNSELLAVFDYLESERGIDRESLFALVEESLLSAARKAVGPANDLHVKINHKTGDIQAFARLTVVEQVTHRDSEILLTRARRRFPDVNVGDIVDWEVTPANFGRIAAQNAKQTILQRLRQAEKSRISEEFQDLLDGLITGVVRRVEHGEVYIDFHRAEGVMRYPERIPGEDYQPGDHITALLIDVNADRPGPSLQVSRSRPEFVVRLFEREVAEIAENVVEIKAIAREAGHRTKIAVTSNDPRVDPVGACVGLRGNRVKTVVRELGGEKVDVIPWSADIREFTASALQPAKLAGAEVDEESHTIRVDVPEDQLSLAIGRRGQNARLAGKLIGWRIDINRMEKPERIGFEHKVQRAIEALAQIPSIGRETAEALVRNGFISLEGILAAEAADLANLEGLDLDRAREIIAAARERLEG
ncbi:MAG: transcription termination/antitermination protein NusA [Kiritimatiellaeota bacterium]|nr:transcription termination/antitermination protein NusA [Kiritimatiellota bacterium]